MFLAQIGAATVLSGILSRRIPTEDAGPFRLVPLPYSYEALEPYINRATMEFHHDKFCAAFVSNLNRLVTEHAPYLASKRVQDILALGLYTVPEEIRTDVSDNAGGIMNHDLFFRGMAPQAGGPPIGRLSEAIRTTFGGYNQFKEKFSAAALKRAGIGWAWLVKNDVGKLEITSTIHEDTPWSNGEFPIVNLDVCEHAYQLQYPNRVEDYIGAWYRVVNWKEAEKRFASAQEG
jgi:Fe-Mn family superoxide dismutase